MFRRLLTGSGRIKETVAPRTPANPAKEARIMAVQLQAPIIPPAEDRREDNLRIDLMPSAP